MIPCKVQDAAGPSSLRSAEAASNGRKNPPRARDTQQRIPLLPKETATLPLDTVPVPPLYGTLTETLFRHAPYPPAQPAGSPPAPGFSNHWKKIFQSLENSRKFFPIIGKTAKHFSNHWKNQNHKTPQTTQRQLQTSLPPCPFCPPLSTLSSNQKSCPELFSKLFELF